MARKKRQYLQPEQTQEPVSSMLPSVWETAIYARLSVENSKKNDDGEYVAEVTGKESAKLTNLGFIGSIDIDYTFSSSKIKNPFTGDGDTRLRQSIRFTPFVAYAKYDKCNLSSINN